jgi:hypothetical protein
VNHYLKLFSFWLQWFFWIDDIINTEIDHEEWREGPGPVTARQPALQGANASLQGIHEAI